ncbi:MAG: hypothetical protein HYX82_02770 [Chloroflexi bacterium]|nr:hypothetical protein [Chloroflexota bacterium]
MRKRIDEDFVQMEVYAIYKAISELFGEKGWQVIWRSGEIVFDDLEKKLKFPDKDPLSVMKVLADYLADVGYVSKIEFRMVGDNVLEFDIYGPSFIRPSVLRLKAEKGVLPHWSTVITVAALKKICGVKAETDATAPQLFKDFGRERWVLSKIK